MKDDELTRAKNGVESAFVTRLESLRERASILNAYQAEVGRPDFATADLARYRAATKEQIEDVAAKYLSPTARVVLRVVPRSKGASK